MISAACRMPRGPVSSLANFSAIVAVMEARMFAFTPLPRPSDSTATTRESSMFLMNLKASPQMSSPCLRHWLNPRSMKNGSLIVRSPEDHLYFFWNSSSTGESA